jgi:hypothetical protein
LFISILVSAQSTTYQGNQNVDFGGAIGQGSLTIADRGDSVSFTLTRGTSPLDSIVVFYVDAADFIGISSTDQLPTSSNIYHIAVSGQNPDGRKSTLTFPSNFSPDLAVVFNKDGGRIFSFPFPLGVFQEGTPLSITPTGTNTSPTYSQTAKKSDLGLGAGSIAFKFIGTYIGNTAFRSNEGFGVSFGSFLLPAGGYKPYAVTTFLTFSSATLPVKLVDFKAAKINDDVSVNWSVADETNIDTYEVQRSSNGVNFTTIATVKAKNASAATSYTYRDVTARGGMNYYRLLIMEKGKSEISKIVSLNITGGREGFVASYKAGKILNVKLSGMNAGRYSISVVNSNGQLVQNILLQHDGTDQTRQFSLKGNLQTGVYRIALQSEAVRYTSSIAVQ